MKSILYTIVISFLLLGCREELIDCKSSIENYEKVYSLNKVDFDSINNIISNSSISNGVLKSVSSDEYTDWSGQVHIKIFSATTAPEKQHYDNWTMEVSDEYVCIGGGACPVLYGEAYLVDSRPKTDFTGWLISSKDHVKTYPHVLYMFAIGLRIDNVSKSDLKSRLRIYTNTSSESNHPNTAVSVPLNYSLIGGGADINYDGFGCLLVGSYPSGQAWYAKGKDHYSPDPSTITAYAIGIEKGTIPGFGDLEINTIYGYSYVANGIGSNRLSVPSGWVTACSGGHATYNGYGRLIQALGIGSISTKDLMVSDSGNSYAYSIIIRKKP